MKLKQRLVIDVVFDNTLSTMPEAWDWNELLGSKLCAGESVTLISAEPLEEADEE